MDIDVGESMSTPEKELGILIEGISILAKDIQDIQRGNTVRERVENGCTDYHETMTEEFKRLGFRAMTYHEIDADVDFLNQTNTGRARGHAIGFVVTRDGLQVLAYDATIAQSAAADSENERVRIWKSDKEGKLEQLADLAGQLRGVFGGSWDHRHMHAGLGF